MNPKSHGVLPVVILTTPEFDASTVDVSTVRFGPGGASEVHGEGHLEDVDRDGDLDLVLHFNIDDTGIGCADTTATLTGKTTTGDPIRGSDSFVTVACQ